MAKKNPQEFPECAKIALRSADFALDMWVSIDKSLFHKEFNSGTGHAFQ